MKILSKKKERMRRKRLNVKERKRRDQEYKEIMCEYHERYQRSDGFDVPSPPVPLIGGVRPVKNVDSPQIKEMAEFAVKKRNLNKGTKMELVKITRATIVLVAGRLYNFTIEVKEDGKIKVCRAKVWWKLPMPDKVFKLTYFRKACDANQGMMWKYPELVR